MPDLVVRRLAAAPPDLDPWLVEQPAAMIYATPAFCAALQTIVGGGLWFLVARRGDALVGVMPYLEHAEPGLGRVVNSLPWYGTHGGCLLADPDDDEVRRALLKAFRAATFDEDLLSATVVLTPDEMPHHATYAEILEPREADDRIGQITALPSGGPGLEERLMATLRQKTRNLVRKSLRQGFAEVVTDEPWAWDFLHRTHVENMAAVGGKPKPMDHFTVFRETLPTPRRRLSIAMAGDKPVAALLLFGFNRTVEYITPVIKVEHRAEQPLSFLIWRGLHWAVEQGYHLWNWGGTWRSQESLHHFKAGWGAEDREYGYLICAPGDAPRRLAATMPQLATAFPYYYLYPFNRLPKHDSP